MMGGGGDFNGRDRRVGPVGGPGLTGGPMAPQMPMGVRPMPMGARPMPRTMTPMAAQQIMPTGRAYAKGGMVGCDWSPKSSTTMRGAARKGK